MNYESRHGHSRTHYADGSRERDERRIEAEIRQTKRDARTPQQQLEVLDRKLGKNTGAIKERLRLHLLLSTTKEPAKKKTSKKKDRK